MRVVYVDTSAFIALLRRRDRDHERVVSHYRRLHDAGDLFLTCNLALSEAITRLRYDTTLQQALVFRDFLERAAGSGRLSVRFADSELDRKAWGIMEKYADQELSFVDCAGAVTAREGHASAVFGLDADFSVLGFAPEPA